MTPCRMYLLKDVAGAMGLSHNETSDLLFYLRRRFYRLNGECLVTGAAAKALLQLDSTSKVSPQGGALIAKRNFLACHEPVCIALIQSKHPHVATAV